MQVLKASVQKHYFLISLMFIMVLYLPVLYFSSVQMDDIGLVQRLHENYSKINFFDLFFRGITARYYRPLLEISFYLDYLIWGVSINGYHFGSFLLHNLNACLVYLITLQLLKPDKNSGLYAVFAMLLFALNPLTCESVAWISGRSDLAGTFFSLLAINFYFIKNPLRFILTPICIFLGLLCKENALSVIPIIVLLEGFLNFQKNRKITENIKGCLVWAFIVFIPLATYFFFRTNGWEHYSYNYIEVSTPFAGSKQINNNSDVLKILYVFPVIAFYLKKLIFPFPLNFAISQINTVFYSVLFVVFFMSNIICLFKRKFLYVFISILLIISFMPALPVALGGVSWVPLAERYLYLSVSIMSIAVAFFLKISYQKGIFNDKSLMIVCTSLIVIFASTTLNREFVWKESKTLWADTLKKNPDNSMVLFKYGQTFGGEEGQWAFKKAIASSENFKWKSMTFMEIAKDERSNGNYDESIVNLEKALEVKKSFTNYRDAAQIVSGFDSNNIQKQQEYINKAIEYFKLAYGKKKTSFVLFKTGILLIKVGKNNEAEELFVEIIRKFPDSKYAFYAKKQLEKND